MAITMETSTNEGIQPVEAGQPPPVLPDPSQAESPGVSDESVPTSAPVPVQEGEESPSPEVPQDGVPQGRGGFQTRIKTLVEQRNVASERATRAEQELAQLRAYLGSQQQYGPPHQANVSATQPAYQPQQPMPQGSQLVPPQPENYTDAALYSRDIELYWRAMAGEEAERIARRLLGEREAAYMQQQHSQVARVWQNRLEEGQASHDDFDAALHVLPRYVPEDLYGTIAEVVVHEDQGAHLLYYLTTHPQAMQELARYRPGKHAAEYLRGLLGGSGSGNGSGSGSGSGQRTNGARTPTTQPPLSAATNLPPVRPLNGTGPVSVGGETPADVVARGGTLAEYEAAKARLKAQGLAR